MNLYHAILVLAAQRATSSTTSMRHSTPVADISATSKVGKKLLSNSRHMEENDEDTTWIAGYSLKFGSCHKIGNIYGAEGAREAEGKIGNQYLVTYKLCPSDSCSNSCSGGEYVTNMREFTEAYLEAKEEAFERACEAAQETCEDYCGNIDDDQNDDEQCKYDCMVNAGMEKCDEEENQQNDDDTYPDFDFEVNEYMECRELEMGDDDSATQYYVGPACNNGGTTINLAMYSDEACTAQVSSDIFKEYYGKSLPYLSESIVSSKCMSCLDDANNGDDDYYQEPLEVCEKLHEEAGRCETKLHISSSYYTPQTGACTYIHKTLPAMVKVSNSEGSALVTATAMAWVFGIASVAFAGLAYHFYTKALRSNVDLLQNKDGATA